MTFTISDPVPTSRLDGKVAIVTGSGRGIGRGIAIELGRRGASVVINYSRSSKPAQDTVAEIVANGTQAIAIKADISQPESITQLFAETLAYFGHIDIVVSNSGMEHFGSIDQITPEAFDQVFGLNTRGQFFVAQNAYKFLSEGGRLMMMSSISAHVGMKEHALYSGSKVAIEAFGRCLTKEFGHKKITVNVIAPGGVDTDMAAEAGWKYIPGADPSWTAEDISKWVAERNPLQRTGKPNDIARVVAFLASEDGGWINGESKGSVSLWWKADMYRPNDHDLRRCFGVNLEEGTLDPSEVRSWNFVHGSVSNRRYRNTIIEHAGCAAAVSFHQPPDSIVCLYATIYVRTSLFNDRCRVWGVSRQRDEVIKR
jgi:NAD(P)-dependent dehydrogenase (short-subunit alcohol dehydrogenase family)